MLTPQTTFTVLLIAQALHLLHHRLAKRHISFAEVASSAVLLIPLSSLPAGLLMGLHLTVAAVQVAGSIWIRRLSPDWQCGKHLTATLG